MSDEERHLVGIRYKKQGSNEATKLGHELVSGPVKEARVDAWCDFIDRHPDAMLYCFRGGQRSQISQQWLAEAGREIVRLEGGYKAFRRYLIEETERSSERFSPIVLGGRTGSGKTILLQELDNAIDLEALANHRGSSFGRHISPQPSQIDFENALAYSLIEKLESGFGHLVFEDEGKNIGKDYLPDSFAEHLSQAPLVILETAMRERVEITFEEYVTVAQQRYLETGFSDPTDAWKQDILQAMARIKKRMGGLRHQRLIELFEGAVDLQLKSGSPDAHKEWVEYLLREYYDPMYDYQIQKRSEQIQLRGDYGEVLDYLRQAERQ
jgi:tRNA 2-selenouridine synthase